MGECVFLGNLLGVPLRVDGVAPAKQERVLRVPFGRALKRLATQLPLHTQVELVGRLLPRRLWFRAALRVAALQGRMVARMGGNGALTRALMLDHWLRELTLRGHYPLPYRVHGREVLCMPGPKLYTWTHLPLVEVPLRAIVEQSGVKTSVVADAGKVIEGERFAVYGVKQHPEALRVEDQLLLRVRRKLQAGETVCFLADHYLGGALSEVPVRLAARLRVPLVMQWAELAPDQVFDVTFRLAPYPCPENEAEVQGNLRFLRDTNRRVLEELNWYQP